MAGDGMAGGDGMDHGGSDGMDHSGSGGMDHSGSDVMDHGGSQGHGVNLSIFLLVVQIWSVFYKNWGMQKLQHLELKA